MAGLVKLKLRNSTLLEQITTYSSRSTMFYSYAQTALLTELYKGEIERSLLGLGLTRAHNDHGSAGFVSEMHTLAPRELELGEKQKKGKEREEKEFRASALENLPVLLFRPGTAFILLASEFG
jgi:hypothetical protein